MSTTSSRSTTASATAPATSCLQKVGETLRSSARDSDLVSRYGGEEFCILLPHMEIEQAAVAAERYRAAIEAMRFEQFSITASFGVASYSGRETTSQELLELADKALYSAKRSGRNRVVRGDRIDQATAAKPPAAPSTAVATPASMAITTQFPLERAVRQGKDDQAPLAAEVVRSLGRALAYRDTMTAEHSRQVAETCMLAAKDLLSQRACHELEIAALLHDIGKLAIPDAVLLKPGSLTADEWAVMRAHDGIGAEILEAAGASSALIQIVRTHHAWYAGSTQNPALPRGEDIPLAARILAIADAFSAIISDRLYRKGRSQDEAFEELRRSAGTQFDPALVEHFIKVIQESDRSRVGPSSDLGKQTVLDIGLQIERLAVALDMRDFTSLSAMSGHLATTAARSGAVEIAELAIRLESSAAAEPDLMTIMQLTRELLDACRSTQRACLSTTENAAAWRATAAGALRHVGEQGLTFRYDWEANGIHDAHEEVTSEPEVVAPGHHVRMVGGRRSGRAGTLHGETAGQYGGFSSANAGLYGTGGPRAVQRRADGDGRRAAWRRLGSRACPSARPASICRKLQFRPCPAVRAANNHGVPT